MPIDKFLYSLKTPDFPPGPFSVRLKYELKQLYFDRKIGKILHLTYSAAILCLVVLCITLVTNPHIASNINNFVFNGNNSTLDKLLLAERDIDISNFSASVRNVSHEINSSLTFLEDDKSYLIHKFKDNDNNTLIYISEVKSSAYNKTFY